MIVLFLYFIVDAIVSSLYGALAGTISGASVGALATLIQYYHNKKRGKSVSLKATIWDIVLLGVFVGIDILCYSTELGDRLMPVVTSFIFTIFFVVVGWYGKQTLLTVLTGGILDRVLVSPYLSYLMSNTMRRLSVWCGVAFVVYLCNYLGVLEGLSDFVDDWFLFVIAPSAYVVEFMISRLIRRRYKDVEWVPLITEEGNIIGQAPRPLVHNGSGWLHPVVHLHVFDEQGRILLQKRPAFKKIQPLKWDTAVGGHISAGEKLEQALQREAREEIGLRDFSAQLTHKYVWRSSVENEYVIAFKAISNGPFNPEIPEEVDELRFWTIDELREEMHKNAKECNLTPNLCEELRRLGIH
ncbi:MAG: NUDIX domain-containing protein [Bacteroidia bacterium]|nr:NUDIX domain-containing protein [Bacteroidia bacterium]